MSPVPWKSGGWTSIACSIILSSIGYQATALIPMAIFIIIGSINDTGFTHNRRRWWRNRLSKPEKIIYNMIKVEAWGELEELMRNIEYYRMVHDNPHLKTLYRKHLKELKEERQVKEIHSNNNRYLDKVLNG